MSFFQRLVGYVVNEVLVDTLANRCARCARCHPGRCQLRAAPPARCFAPWKPAADSKCAEHMARGCLGRHRAGWAQLTRCTAVQAFLIRIAGVRHRRAMAPFKD